MGLTSSVGETNSTHPNIPNGVLYSEENKFPKDVVSIQTSYKETWIRLNTNEIRGREKSITKWQNEV